MKKTLIALSAFAVTSAAMAQITISGRIDAAIGVKDVTSTSDEGVTTTTDNGTELINGTTTGSRLIFRGSEDLGGGMSAIFKLENRFNIDTGTDTSGFSGDAFLGLQGNFGAVHAGRSYTAFDSAKGLSVSNSVFDTDFTPTGTPSYTLRAANQIKYISPSFSGFTLEASTAFKETSEAGIDDTNSASLAYSAGPLKIAAGIQTETDGDHSLIAVAYDFGVAAVSAGYGALQGADKGDDTAGFNVGVTVPMGAIKVSIGYGYGETESYTGADVSEYEGIGLAATYSLSKRSTLYAGYKDEQTENTAGTKISGQKGYAVGMRHNF